MNSVSIRRFFSGANPPSPPAKPLKAKKVHLTKDGDLTGFGSSEEEIDEKTEEKKVRKYRKNIFIDDCAVSTDEETDKEDEEMTLADKNIALSLISDKYIESKRDVARKNSFFQKQFIEDDNKLVEKIKRRFVKRVDLDEMDKRIKFSTENKKIVKKVDITRLEKTFSSRRVAVSQPLKQVKERQKMIRKKIRRDFLSSESESEDFELKAYKRKKFAFNLEMQKKRKNNFFEKNIMSQQILSSIERRDLHQKQSPKKEKLKKTAPKSKPAKQMNFSHFLPKTQNLTKNCHLYKQHGSLLKSIQRREKASLAESSSLLGDFGSRSGSGSNLCGFKKKKKSVPSKRENSFYVFSTRSKDIDENDKEDEDFSRYL